MGRWGLVLWGVVGKGIVVNIWVGGWGYIRYG